jgi:hypothetical protein
MALPTNRLIRWSILGSLVVVLCYVSLLVGNPNDLEGKVSSYELFPHDRRDVLEFENGLVTLKTCCGNSYYGDYMRKDDSWVWEHQMVWRRNPPEFKFKKPVKIEVDPHLFSITIRFDDGRTLKLPRRVFKSIRL